MGTQHIEVREYRARGTDDRVHLVDAGPDALLDPSPYRTRCGQAVFEVYGARLDATCPACADLERPDAVSAGRELPAAPTTIGRGEPGRLTATAAAVVLLVVGIVALVVRDSGAIQFGVLHVAVGVAGLALASTGRGARVFLVGGAAAYLLLWLYGVVDQAVAWPLLFLAAGMAFLAFLVGTPRRSTNTPMH